MSVIILILSGLCMIIFGVLSIQAKTRKERIWYLISAILWTMAMVLNFLNWQLEC